MPIRMSPLARKAPSDPRWSCRTRDCPRKASCPFTHSLTLPGRRIWRSAPSGRRRGCLGEKLLRWSRTQTRGQGPLIRLDPPLARGFRLRKLLREPDVVPAHAFEHHVGGAAAQHPFQAMIAILALELTRLDELRHHL